MCPNAEKPYQVVRTFTSGEWLYAVVHVPNELVLMYSRTGAHARMVARWFNEWDCIPVLPYPYDGSQWEVDPIQ